MPGFFQCLGDILQTLWTSLPPCRGLPSGLAFIGLGTKGLKGMIKAA